MNGLFILTRIIKKKDAVYEACKKIFSNDEI